MRSVNGIVRYNLGDSVRHPYTGDSVPFLGYSTLPDRPWEELVSLPGLTGQYGILPADKPHR